MKPAYIIALLILVVTAGVTLFSFSSAVAQHVTVAQAMSRPGEMVQVPGKIVKESVVYDSQAGQLRFDIVEPNGTARMPVVYAQPKPENFDSAVSVEAIGQYKDGRFQATNLLVKCPSKYSDQSKKT